MLTPERIAELWSEATRMWRSGCYGHDYPIFARLIEREVREQCIKAGEVGIIQNPYSEVDEEINRAINDYSDAIRAGMPK